jgi:hypothetical protein
MFATKFDRNPLGSFSDEACTPIGLWTHCALCTECCWLVSCARDLSKTSITHLPTSGLHELDVLRLEDTETLKTFPSIYNFEVSHIYLLVVKCCWLLLRGGIVKSVPWTAVIFWSVVHPCLSSNHSWFIYQSSLANTNRGICKEKRAKYAS